MNHYEDDMTGATRGRSQGSRSLRYRKRSVERIRGACGTASGTSFATGVVKLDGEES